MKNTAMIPVLLALFLLLTSCSFFKKKEIKIITPAPPPKIETKIDKEAEKVGVIQEAVTTEATSVKTDSASIKSEAEAGKKVAPAPQWETIQQKAERIRASSETILGKAKELTGVQVKLGNADTEVKQLEKFTATSAANIDVLMKTVNTQKEEIAAYKSGAKKQQQTIWMGVSALAAIGLVLGIALTIYVSPKAGVGLIVGSLILAPVAYFFAQYAFIVAIVGGVFFLLVIGYLIVWAALHRKALVESMVSFEVTKNKLWTDPTTKALVNTVQSNTTRNIVRSLKFKENIGQ